MQIEAPVDAAIRAENRGDVIAAALDQVEVDQVDRRPRHQHQQQRQNQSDELRNEIRRGTQRHHAATCQHHARQQHTHLDARRPLAGKGLDRGDDRQHRAVQIQRVVADDIEQKQHHQNRPQPPGGLLDRSHRFGAFRRCQNRHRAKAERQNRPQRRPQISGPERFGDTDIRRQITRIIGHVRREADLPDDPQRHRRQPTRQVETAARQEVCRQVVSEDVNETGEQRAAHHPGADAVQCMDEVVADHTNRSGRQCANQNAQRRRYRRCDTDNRFTGKHDVGNEETDVDQRRKKHDQQCAVTPELATALNHLRNAHARALRRRQGDHHAADQVPQRNRQQPPKQVEMEHLNHHGAGDDGQWRDVGAEP